MWLPCCTRNAVILLCSLRTETTTWSCCEWLLVAHRTRVAAHTVHHWTRIIWNACEIMWFLFCTIADKNEASGLNPEMAPVSETRTTVSGSPRGHVRSYSDVTPTVADEHDSKQSQHADKKTVKAILSHLLPTPTAMAPIQVSSSLCISEYR
jgi:hypothetical protein